MARKSKTDAAAAPKQTIEDLSDDQRYSLTEQHKRKYETLLEAKKKTAKDLMQFCKVIKADLGANGLDEIKSLIEGKTPEGEATIKARIERDMRVLRWMGVPIGSQADLFPTTDRTPITERAFNEGKRQGLAGENNNNPHHHTTEAHRFHEQGYEAGQAANASGFKKLQDAPPKGSVPREQWAKDLREQNEDVERQIKQSASLGSSRPTYEMN